MEKPSDETPLGRFASAMQLVFLIAAAIAMLGFLLALALRELPLRTMSGMQARHAEETRGS